MKHHEILKNAIGYVSKSFSALDLNASVENAVPDPEDHYDHDYILVIVSGNLSHATRQPENDHVLFQQLLAKKHRPYYQ